MAASGLEVNVLMIEDSDFDVELAMQLLRKGGVNCQYRVVDNEVDLRRALQECAPDFILSDFTLPGFDGMTALAIASQVTPDAPFIFLSGTMGEERAIDALRLGAVDYVLKSNLIRLVPAVMRALAEAEQRRTSRLDKARVARLSGVLQMLSGINTAVVRIQDRDTLLKEVCRLAHSVGGYPMAVITAIDPTTRTARPVASAGLLAKRVSSHLFTIADSEDGDTSLMGRVMRNGEAVLCDDIAGASQPITNREELVSAGIRSLACLPLIVDKTPVGAFLFGAVESGLVGHDELKLLHEVAANLSFALQYLDKRDAVHFLAYFDPLTGLAKRPLFCERLGRLLVRGAARLPVLAVKVFDIDHLSVINDSFGRHVGDRLLQCVADRLKTHCSDTERLAHLGGGTFVWVTALGEVAPEELHGLHQEITRLFDAPFVVEGHDIAITVKCGFACYPNNGDDPNELVQNAEAALKEAKTSGEQYLHHRLEMNSALAQRVRLEYQLRTALQCEQFELHYQPKLLVRTGKIEGAEALLRWRDPERGLVAPATFLPILESAGLMPAISAWVLRKAAEDCSQWRRSGLPPVRVAVNIGPPELRRRGFVPETLETIGALASDGEWGIDIEVTEGALFGDSSSCIHALRLLRTAGVRIAIDDFGTGYSSLGRLSELPIDSLKIDRVFTSRLPTDRKSAKLVSTIIDLAHAFDMTTVAEGVETREQLEFLAHCECDESQGFLHSRAVPRAEFEQLLGSHCRPRTARSA
jgi:diguanylate cyclase (GGDEF)-like protein